MMKTQDIEAIATEIAELTKYNDHNQALICSSMLADNINGVKESNETKILKCLREAHLHKGYMSAGLLAEREDIRPKVMDRLKKGLSEKQYQLIYEAL